MKERFGRHFLLNRSFAASFFAIAIPIAMQNMISFGVAAMDSVMLGSFGDVAIAAASLASQPFSILMTFGFGLTSGGSVLIAQYWGKGDTVRIRKVMRMSMQIVFIVSLLMTLLCTLMPEQILSIFTKDKAIIRSGAQYLAVCALSYVPFSIANNYILSMRAVEKVKMSTVIYIISFFVNVFFNYALIFGRFGMPRMEVRGAALGTLIARLSELAMVLYYMYAREHTVGFRIGDCLTFDSELIPSYIRHSLPIVGNELIWSVGFASTSIIVGRVSSAFVAANSISTVLNQLMCISVAGLANAAAVLTGKSIGRGDTRAESQKVANTLFLFGAWIGIFNFMFMLAIRPLFLRLYSITPETYAATYAILGVQAVLQLVYGIDMTGIVGILRGGGDTRTAFLFDSGSLWFVSIPMGILSGFVFHWPVPVIFLCLKLDCPLKAALSLIRVHSGKWIRNVTIPDAPAAQS